MWSIMKLNFTQGVDMAHASAAASTAPEDLSGPALRAFFALAGEWQLRAGEQRILLGQPPESTFYKWKRHGQGVLDRDTLERISYLLGIYKSLQILFPDPERAADWIRRPNDAGPFGGRSALERMLCGQVADLYEVRRYLDAQRGWN